MVLDKRGAWHCVLDTPITEVYHFIPHEEHCATIHHVSMEVGVVNWICNCALDLLWRNSFAFYLRGNFLNILFCFTRIFVNVDVSVPARLFIATVDKTAKNVCFRNFGSDSTGCEFL